MTSQTKEIIKSTAPIIKKHGEQITTEMYKILFDKYPETKELFKDAEKDQYKKLANMIYSYADNIEHLDRLQVGIKKVAKIHIDTKILPKHYPMVGDSLIGAMKNVLGDGATTEVVDAWSEAYNFLSDIFIESEKKLYNQ